MNDSALIPLSAGLDDSLAIAMPKHVAAVVPFKDHEAFGKLAIDQKARVSFLLQLFAEMKTSPEGLVHCSNRLAAINPGRGFSGSNLRTLYYAFRKRGWRALAKIYKTPDQLPEEFAQEVRRRMEANARSSRAAIQELRDEWAQGKAIPGYGTWRDYHAVTRPELDIPERYPFGYFPAGWSEANLYRKQSSKAERTLKRQGYAAAKRYLPHVVRDVSALRFLELIVIDDFETDQLVRAWNPELKRWVICRCAGLLAIDAATRTKLAIGLKPRFKDEDGKKLSLTRADVQQLLFSVFSAHGLPTEYGCTILCENAAAAITAEFELVLELLLGVQVSRTGLIAEKTLRNGFLQSGGKPWEKGWIESMFNLMHNTAGALPGQKGASYQLKPADLEAKILYSEKLLNTDGLPAEVAQQMRVPFLSVEDFLTGYEKIFERMEDRTDHRCQGFVELFDYRAAHVAGLLPESALALMSPDQVLACEPVPRRESPRERRERLAAACSRRPVADYVLACLLLTPKKLQLRNHRLAFKHAGADFTFADADSPVMKLDEGTEVLGYFDASRPDVLHVTDLKGQVVGKVRRRGAVNIMDAAAISAEAGEVERLVRSCVKGPLQVRHAAENEQLGADRAHNDALLASQNLLPAGSPQSASRALSNGNSSAPAPVSGSPRVNTATQSAGLSSTLARGKAPSVNAAAGLDLAQSVSADLGEKTAGSDRASALQNADDLDAGNLL